MSEISVLLVDDFKEILEYAVQKIDWPALGFRIVGTASNGENALEAFKELQPQLVITDVVMPIMNGLELIREIRKINPEVEILLISSYEEFAYVKEAIALGARDYIIKSELFEDTFAAKMRVLHANISNDLSMHAQHAREVLEDYFSEDGVKAEVSTETDRYISMRTGKRYYFALYFEPKAFDFREEKRGQKVCVSNIHRSLTAQRDMFAYRSSDMFFCIEDFLAVVMAENGTEIDEWERMDENIWAILPQMRHRLYTRKPYELAEFRALLEKRWNTLRYFQHFPMQYPMAIETLPCDAEQQERFDYIRLIDENADFQVQNQTISHYLQQVGQKYDYTAISIFIRRFVIQMETLTMFHYAFPEKRSFGSIMGLIEWVLQAYSDCLDIAMRAGENSYSQPVRMAIKRMEQQYADPQLRAEDIAAAAALSLSRMQVIFKKETQKTINEYLTDMRIKRAIQLLENSTMKIYEIAEKVGYSSAQYFSTVLYQRTRKRPLDYRRAASD